MRLRALDAVQTIERPIMRLVVPFIAVAILALTGCGSDSSNDGGSVKSPPKTPSVASDTGDGASTSDSGTGSENKGTGSENAGTGSEDSGAGSTHTEALDAAQKRLTALVECMRDKGYEMPEVTPETTTIVPENTEGMDPDKVNADSQECVEKVN